MSNQKKQSFLGGAAILAAAVVVVKFIGFFYKVPLNNILGGPGKTYFDTAYKIYNFLLTFSTAGLPLAISKLTSQAWRPSPSGRWLRRCAACACWPACGATPRARAT